MLKIRCLVIRNVLVLSQKVNGANPSSALISGLVCWAVLQSGERNTGFLCYHNPKFHLEVAFKVKNNK